MSINPANGDEVKHVMENGMRIGIQKDGTRTMLCKANGGCSGGIMIEEEDGTWRCDVCMRRVY